MALKWLHRFTRRFLDKNSGADRQKSYRPRIETLEDRMLLATRIWDAGGNTNLWTDSKNWQGDLAPTAGDDLVFGDLAPVNERIAQNDFGGSPAFNSITFNAGGYTLTGNGVTLGAGGVTHDAPGASDINVIDLSLVLNGTRNFTVVQDNLDDALLVQGFVGGSGGINKLGAGSMGLGKNGAVANGYTGSTSVSQGTLTLHSNGALGNISGVTQVLAGATLELDPGVALSVSEALTLSGGTLRGSTNSTWSGAINLTNDSRIEGANFFSVTNVVSGVASADLAIDGTLFLTGANTYQGFTTIESGVTTLGNNAALGSTASGTRVLDGAVLNLGSGRTLGEGLFLNGSGSPGGGSATGAPTLAAGAATGTVTGDIVIESDIEIAVASGGKLTLTGSISGDPTATLSKLGTGELEYAQSSTESVTFTGRTDVNGGTLTLHTPNRNAVVGDLAINSGTVRLLGTVNANGVQTPGTGNNQIADAVTVFIAQSGLLDLNDNSDTIGGLNLTGGDVDSGTGTLTLNGDVTTNASNSSAVIDGKLNLGSASRGFNVANGAAIADLVISAVISGGSSAQLIKNGTGTMNLNAANDYQGQTIVNGGFLVANVNSALGSTNLGTTVNAGATLLLNTGVSVAENIGITGTGVNNNGALSTTGNSAVTAGIGVTGDATINVGTGGTLSVNNVGSSILGGPTSLTKIGAGTLAYVGTGLNQFFGVTRVHDGTLRLDKAPDALSDLFGGGAITSGLVIGDGVGIDKVELARDNQISDSVAISINEGGELDLFNNDDKLGALTFQGGRLETGSGTATLGADVTVNGSSQTAFIIGNVSLGEGPGVIPGFPGPNGVDRIFTVADGLAASDLLINSALTSVGQVNLVKSGAGTLEIAGGPTGVVPNYLGTTNVLEGTLLLNRPDGVAAVAPQALIVGDATSAPGTARVVLGSNDQVPSITVNRSGVFDLNGHNENIAQPQLAGGQVDTNGGTLTIASLVSQPADVPAVINGKLALSGTSASFILSGDVIVNADVSGAQLSKVFGTGTLTLNGNNTLTSMQVRDGKVLINGSQPATPVTVDAFNANGAALGGDGGSSGAVTVFDGTLAPGEEAGDAGLLTVVNGLTFSSAQGGVRRFDVDLNGSPNAGVNHDQVSVLGAVTLGNGITSLNVATPSRFTANAGDTFIILSNDGNDAVSGRFAGLADEAPLTINGQAFRIDYNAGDGNDVALIRNTAAMITDVEVTPTIDEGGFVTFSGRLVDPDAGAKLSFTIDWGDGSPPETIRPGLAPFTLNHQYRDDPAGSGGGQFLVRFSWTDGLGEVRSDSRLVTVNNVAPTVFLGGDAVIREDQKFQRSGFFSDPGADRFQAKVNFGDGSGDQHLEIKDGRFVLKHRFDTPGTYLVTVTVIDDDGGIGVESFFVTVEEHHRGRR